MKWAPQSGPHGVVPKSTKWAWPSNKREGMICRKTFSKISITTEKLRLFFWKKKRFRKIQIFKRPLWDSAKNAIVFQKKIIKYLKVGEWSIPDSDYDAWGCQNFYQTYYYYTTHSSSSLGTLLFDSILKYTSFPSLISIRLLSSKSHKKLHNLRSRKLRWNQRNCATKLLDFSHCQFEDILGNDLFADLCWCFLWPRPYLGISERKYYCYYNDSADFCCSNCTWEKWSCTSDTLIEAHSNHLEIYSFAAPRRL